MKFSDICFITEDVPKLRGFYEALFSVAGEGDEYHASIEGGGLTLAIDSARHLAQSETFGYVTGKSSGNTIIGFDVDDVDATHEKLKKLGVEMLNEPTTHPWGARSFQCKDPDGNILNFRTVKKA